MEMFYKLLLIFFFYSFMGWLIESTCKLIELRRFVNRGFLTGPICPIYGVGGVIILLTLSKYNNDPVVLYFMSIVIAAILEYFTSFAMEKIFKNRWWDYSNWKFNINGRICLETMIPFGFLSLLMIYIVNPCLLNAISLMNYNIMRITAITLSLLTIIDIIISFNIIITLENVSNSLRTDSTEVITKKVRNILHSKTILHRRLIESFPNMQIFNKSVVIKRKINKQKEKLKRQKLKNKGKIKKVEKKKKNK
ncbi:MAG: putative ABC transporter permease [Erysipelotrichales bacterium]|nr:putative ABC transporter permease [Erysipelotrichales bacterium]